MGDVVGLPRQTWVCACGCNTFRLLAVGPAECAACDSPVTDGGRGWRPDSTKEDSGETRPFVEIGDGSVAFAKHRLRKLAMSEDAVLIVVADEDGSVHVWSDAATKEQAKWARRKMSTAARLLKTHHAKIMSEE